VFPTLKSRARVNRRCRDSVPLSPSFPESIIKQRGTPLIHLRLPAVEVAGSRCLFEAWAICHKRAVQNDKPWGEEARLHFLC